MPISFTCNLLLPAAVLFLALNGIKGNQFVDDYGKVHVLFHQPKIVASAHTAAALLHLGKSTI